MKKFLFLTLLLISVFLSVSPALAVRVRGYRRKDGVYVKSHTRRKPRRYRRRRYGALPAELQAPPLDFGLDHIAVLWYCATVQKPQ